ncbi:MAG: BlaI/MecI/CopY family transcriptional regulator [Phycisphaerae bacterium]|nr:BlaI/MecI/CopY family transcriptional regulator [Phycisphaerae bacterium]
MINTDKPDDAKKNMRLTEAEWAIMRVVWEEQPCTAGTVQEALVDIRGWAYSTVKTTMDRMTKKGLLSIGRIRHLQLFSANISIIESKKREIFHTIRRAFNGAMTPMMQFLLENEELSHEELQQLHEILNKKAQSTEN